MTPAEEIKKAAAAMRRPTAWATEKALARLLDNAADAWNHGDLCLDCFHPTCLTVNEALTVARAINGESK